MFWKGRLLQKPIHLVLLSGQDRGVSRPTSAKGASWRLWKKLLKSFRISSLCLQLPGGEGREEMCSTSPQEPSRPCLRRLCGARGMTGRRQRGWSCRSRTAADGWLLSGTVMALQLRVVDRQKERWSDGAQLYECIQADLTAPLLNVSNVLLGSF